MIRRELIAEGKSGRCTRIASNVQDVEEKRKAGYSNRETNRCTKTEGDVQKEDKMYRKIITKKRI